MTATATRRPRTPTNDVNKKTLRRTKDWGLPSRTKGVGSGDAPTILGISPWKSAYKLFMEKTGRIPRETFDEELAYWGKMLEPLVSQRYMQDTGRKLMDRAGSTKNVGDSRFDMRVHPKYDWMIANLDYEIIDPDLKALRSDAEPKPIEDDGPGVYEGKCTSTFMRKEWDNDIPETVMAQLQHQMTCADMKWGSAGVLIGGNNFRWIDVIRDDELCAMLIELEDEFWQNCLAGTPPQIDGSAATTAAIKLLFPDTDGSTITLGESASKIAHSRMELLDKKKAAQVFVDEVQVQLSEVDNFLKGEIGEATFAKFADGGDAYFSLKKTTVAPQQREGYSFRSLRYHKK